jgi:hypothetical protein
VSTDHAPLLPEAARLARAYDLYRNISRFPDLLGEMRATFLDVLVERGLTDRSSVDRAVRERIAAEGLPDSEERRREIEAAFIDLLFADSLSGDEIGNYVNLVRKRDKCRELARVVGSDHATAPQVHQALKEFCDIPKGEVFISPEEAEGIRVSLLSAYLSSQLPFISVAKQHVTIRDINAILDHTIGHREYPGRLGGKAAGMIVAQKILLPILKQPDPDFERFIRVPDTWYVSSGVLSDFIDRNGFHVFHSHKYRDREAIETQVKDVERMFAAAAFPPDVMAAFRGLMETVGEHPIIVRSSSYLEDSFGLAFSGKYKSVFLANQGDVETRLAAFVGGVKAVLASVYGPDPILYRRDHGLLDYNERMAVIVQKVVGRRFGDWFFPFASGVMFSYNSYAWSPKIRKEDGIVRLVFGLGTRAVDRVGPGYPRMIPLSHPQLRPEVTAAEITHYSQHMVDALDLKRGKFKTVDFATLARETGHPDLYLAVSVAGDGDLRPPLTALEDLGSAATVLTFDNFIARSPFVPLVKRVLATVQAAYGRPVDIEFAWDDGKFYLLQCRSLATRREIARVVVPMGTEGKDRLFVTRSGLCNAVLAGLEYIVYVDPRAYERLASASEKRRIAWAVGQLNRRLAGKVYALMGPGRWGSNDLNLGVPVGYADINNTRLLVEIAFARNGAVPEVSFGTHFFQDLVESDIAYTPLFPDEDGSELAEGFLLSSENQLAALDGELAPLAGVVHVVHVPSARPGQLLDVYLDAETQVGMGVFA